jgi:hypothetical protein
LISVDSWDRSWCLYKVYFMGSKGIWRYDRSNLWKSRFFFKMTSQQGPSDKLEERFCSELILGAIISVYSKFSSRVKKGMKIWPLKVAEKLLLYADGITGPCNRLISISIYSLDNNKCLFKILFGEIKWDMKIWVFKSRAKGMGLCSYMMCYEIVLNMNLKYASNLAWAGGQK